MNRAILGQRSILEVALEVHMTATGSYDRPEHEQELDITILKNRLETWEHSLTNALWFDNTVKALITAAIWEVEAKVYN
jgi:hypothetical protein